MPAPFQSSTITTPIEALHALESARAARGVSKAELARRSRVLPQTVRRLLSDDSQNPTVTVLLDLLRALGLGLGFVEQPRDAEGAGPDQLYARLASLGAPLYGATTVDTRDGARPEVILTEGLVLSRRDATLARALPVALWKSRKRINHDFLRKEARRWSQARALGFFLDLTAVLSGDPTLAREAAKLRGHAPLRTRQFFEPTTPRERQLAELKTPDVARRWGFRMNMDLDSFASTFRKVGRKRNLP
jgi:transcriptional regulator with XRE-family HTH domain